ncbi:DUF294 nucleotidyltransferase-like domain-containing protein [Pontibacillus litoralis]|uniref:CBS domain-containing protein n=1 Tax=Pontibacillus litoralis JSM 072002 TaxID=1385512 RepID=A0A0A5GCI5_9BACI|nr:DUF294 nucleotidyltransferase-like domain-containing protein [Pontibacillus litoralis]KGX88825.1 hypothetical protein N784_00290 [Pontibacillus litoralis JSM 072002]
MEKYIDMFKHQHPFNMLTTQQLEQLFTGASLKVFETNEFLFHEDEEEDDINIHFVLTGLAKNIMHKSNGKQISVRFYYPGDIVGIMIILTSGEMKFSVQAIEETKALRFQKEQFMAIMSENQAFSKIVMDGISNLMKSLYHEVKYKAKDGEDDFHDRKLFKQRVDNYVELPYFISPTATLTEAVYKMQQYKLGGLIVSTDDLELIGVLNYQDIFKAYVNHDFDSLVDDYVKEEPYTVTDRDFIYNAISFLKHNPASIIPVMNKTKVVGQLRQTSLLTIEDSIYFDLRYRIQKANSIEEVKQLAPKYNRSFQHFVAQLLEDQMFAYDVCELISSYNDEIHHHIIQLAEDDMIQEGYGTPPINYCFIVMGSEGRKEQAFSTDQDNGIIIADYSHLHNKDQIDSYFKQFTHKINTKLQYCGYPLCTGGIMAKEDKWRNSLQAWRISIDTWLEKLDAQEIRDFTIFMDFRPIVGDFSLAYELRDFVTKRMQRSLNLQQLLMKDTLRFRVPIQPFGRIIGTGPSRSLDFKKAAIMQIINALRIYAVKYGVEEVNSMKRLEKLEQNERFHPRDAENARLALHRLLKFRLEQNLHQLQNGKPLSNEIMLTQLSRGERKLLKEALHVAKRLQQVLEISYNRNRVV